MNIQRARQAALDIGQHVIRSDRPGAPQSATDVFDLLYKGNIIQAELADARKRMVGFRNIAVHDDQTLHLPIVVAIIESHLEDFLRFSTAMLSRGGPHTHQPV